MNNIDLIGRFMYERYLDIWDSGATPWAKLAEDQKLYWIKFLEPLLDESCNV